ncbi:hypothetical protein TNCV_3042491 [Trichonephila clavipes]|nr:hypothetical protein TNCV_3042491 [Trichonephila clavipes]
MTQRTAPWGKLALGRGFEELLRIFGLVRWGLGGSGRVRVPEKAEFCVSGRQIVVPGWGPALQSGALPRPLLVAESGASPCQTGPLQLKGFSSLLSQKKKFKISQNIDTTQNASIKTPNPLTPTHNAQPMASLNPSPARYYRQISKLDTLTVEYAHTYRILCAALSARDSVTHKLPAAVNLLALDVHLLDMLPQIAI